MPRYRHTRRKSALMSEINVVPYIDVMLVLLVIFMITAPLLKSGVEVNLPNTSAAPIKPEQQADPLILSVSSTGEWYLNIAEQPQDPLDQTLAAELAVKALRERPDRAVLVAADQEVAYGRVMEAMAVLQGAGAPQVQLMSDPPR